MSVLDYIVAGMVGFALLRYIYYDIKRIKSDKIRKDYLLRKLRRKLKSPNTYNYYSIKGYNEAIKDVINLIDKSNN